MNEITDPSRPRCWLICLPWGEVELFETAAVVRRLLLLLRRKCLWGPFGLVVVSSESDNRRWVE